MIECEGSLELEFRACHNVERSYTFQNVLFVPVSAFELTLTTMALVTKTRRDTNDAMLWPQRLGNLNQQNLSSLVSVGELEFFEVCAASKCMK